MRISGPAVVAFWACLLAVLTILLADNGGSWFEIGLWLFAVSVVFLTACLALVADRRAPVHRGQFVVPLSALPALLCALGCVDAALAVAYGIWFAVTLPVPFAAALFFAARDHRLKRRLLAIGAVDESSAARRPDAGHRRRLELPERIEKSDHPAA